MREIKFKGKRLDNGEWVFGWFVGYSNAIGYIYRDWIDREENYRVPMETVGQYTGLKDKNGKEIYEGDIVIANLKYFDIKNEKCKVIFKEGSFGMQYGYCDDYFKSFSAWDDFEVIGSMHDNHELLEAKK